MFKGYCYMEDGTHTEPVDLDSPEDAVNYCKLQMIVQHEVRIMDEDDYVVLHAKDRKIIYPSSLDCDYMVKDGVLNE